MRTPSTQELAEQHLSGLEGAVSQRSPLNNKAFLRVLSVVLALAHRGVYKVGEERSKQNLALTATGTDLDLIGEENGVPRKGAEAAAVTVTIPAADDITVPITATFIAALNGQLYTVNGPAVGVLGSATVSLTCTTLGAVGNLQPGDTLNIVSPLPGVGAIATVDTVDNVGAEEEEDDEYRLRVLFAIRATKGGGNANDYKTWAEGVAGVVRAFPYAGKPAGGGTSYPGDRTVYVEADTSIDPDGVPTVGLLDEVRAAVNYDPVTGLGRPALGLIDDTLYIEPITRTAFNVTITNLVAPGTTEADVRNKISQALTLYFPLFAPYVDGVDLTQDRNDRVTTPALSTALQEVLDSTGSSAASIAFDVAAVNYTSYQLSAGQLAKLGVITYAVV